MNDRQLKALIKRYYSKSLTFHRKRELFAVKLNYPVFYFYCAGFALIIWHLISQVTPTPSLGYYWDLLGRIIIFLIAGGFISCCTIFGQCENYVKNRQATLLGKGWARLVFPVKARGLLRRNPYCPELILWTVEGYEVELREKKGKLDQSINNRERELARHKNALEKIGRDINSRIVVSEPDSDQAILLIARFDEAKRIYENLVQDLKYQAKRRELAETAVEPAFKLVEQLRFVYRDGLEIASISAAASCFGNETSRAAERRELANFQAYAMAAAQELDSLLLQVSSQQQAVEELSCDNHNKLLEAAATIQAEEELARL